MVRQVTARVLFQKHVAKSDNVLLVNPPVEETRYSWLRWNQPLDLIKLGAALRTRVGCKVALLDYLRPSANGDVPEQWLPRDRRYLEVQGERFPMRRYGLPYGALTDWVTQRRAASRKAIPTQVWITSLCSYWFDSIAEMCRVTRQALPDAQIVLIGQYPRLMPDHAKHACAADLMVSTSFDLDDVVSDFGLYEGQPPPFIAVQTNPKTAIPEIKDAVGRGVCDVAFFSDDICHDDGEPIAQILAETVGLHKHLRFNLICGVHPARITHGVATKLAGKNIAQIHLEESRVGSELDRDAYQRAIGYLAEHGLRHPDDRLSGFVWIGHPQEDLEGIVRRVFAVLELLGGIILKPFTPTPGSPEHRKHARYLADIPHKLWSPHFFPFAELNGITRAEYHDLYRMAAFLNERVRNRAFDFLKGTLGADLLRESLRREVWKLEPSPLRTLD